MQKILHRIPGILFLLLCLRPALALGAPLPVVKAWRGNVVHAQAVRRFSPEIIDQSIVCGNKRLSFTPTGGIQLRAGGDLLTDINYYFYLRSDDGQIRWLQSGSPYDIDAGQSRLERQGQDLIFSGIAHPRGIPAWKALERRMTILEDGRIRLVTRWFPLESTAWQYNSLGVLAMFPQALAENKTFLLNGREVRMAIADEQYLASDCSRDFEYRFFPGDPAREFALTGTYTDTRGTGFSTSLDRKAGRFRLSLGGNPDTCSNVFILDVSRGIDPADAEDVRCGIDFKALDDLEMPWQGERNLLINPSFEQGALGYQLPANYSSNHCSPELWNMKLYEIDGKISRFGRHSLRMATSFGSCFDYRGLYTTGSLGTSPVVVPPGVYTLSWSAKGDQPDGQLLNLWVPHFSTGNRTLAMPGALKTCRLKPGWERFAMTFKVPVTMLLSVRFNASSRQRRGNAWLDGIQLEKGTQGTVFETAPVEGMLKTAREDNFLSTRDPLDVRIILATSPSCTGEATIAMKNFFGERIEMKMPFSADAGGTAVLRLPADAIVTCGKGICLMKCGYRLADGRACHEFHRLTRIDFLENRHPLRRMFSNTYGSDWARFDFRHVLDRYRKIGIGTQHHVQRWEKAIYDEYHRHGIDWNDSFMGCDIRKPGDPQKKIGFGLRTLDMPEHYLTYPDCPELLVRDFHLDNGGRLTPEYLETFKRAAQTLAARFPWVKLWCLQGEFKARFPDSWWSREGTEAAAAEAHGRILKAFCEGVKAGNPQAGVFQDDPCNMAPAGGIAETDQLLSVTNRLGVKFDMIGIHPYRRAPENPDLDEDTRIFLNMLDRRGYGDTPVFWPEMMHWGPYEIPQLEIRSADWSGSSWQGQWGALSYDMGWTEKISAAWRARAWLVALKYASRVKSAQSGNVNNFALDFSLTPYASQLISNTLGNLLGDAEFREDIRFAPDFRCYLFEDRQRRPVAALWCHLETVDQGRSAAPLVQGDFGSHLEQVFDLMNQARGFTPGRLAFPVGPFPVFLRGKPGSLPAMKRALARLRLLSGEGISPIAVSVRPVSPKQCQMTVRNLVSNPLQGTINGRALKLPGTGKCVLDLPLPVELSDGRIARQALPVSLETADSSFRADSSFSALLCSRLDDRTTWETIVWDGLASIPLAKAPESSATSGVFRCGWNTSGLFLEVQVSDPCFVHDEYPRYEERWKNDCLQIYFDTLADARTRNKDAYDENDYEYNVFPNARGDSAVVYRARLVDQQLGLGNSAPAPHTTADDIPVSFARTGRGYTYRLFLPARNLLPIRFAKGTVFGFSLFAPNVDDRNPQRKDIDSALTLATDGKGCFNRPRHWPLMLLWDK